ncbi:kelch domain-containing protein 3 isoform X2 [Zootermopsis nevadensis]|uniref:kelch domain-containing protein 3 isoform X2 n=1 Tax=Zootermopsis nevadensis TaxID=136037 RepID=UPI000B8E2DB6|nr:kelch domain-containing protein 3 isoform X2 [Zootermopsis nevadensis]
MYWTVHLEGGPRRVNHAAVVVEDKIFSFGGYCTGDNYRERRPMDIHVLNTSNFRWHALPLSKQNDPDAACVPYQRYGHTAVAYGDKIFVWGGRNDEAACNVLFCFDTSTLQWSCPEVTGMIPGARDGHSACVINHCMYVFGGFEEEIDRFSQDVHALDFRTMHWNYIITQGEPPSYRDFHSATALEGRMYIFGGRGDLNGPYHSQEEVYCSDIMYLDTHTGRWHRPVTSGDIPIGRRSHSAFVYKGNLYIFGGYNGLHDEHFNDLYRFSSEHNEWQLLKPLGKPPSKRRRQACLLVGDKVFLFGGTSPFPVPNPHGIQDYDIDGNHQGLEAKLVDHSDLHVLDFAPTLHTLCLLVVIQNHLEELLLPEDINPQTRRKSLRGI